MNVLDNSMVFLIILGIIFIIEALKDKNGH